MLFIWLSVSGGILAALHWEAGPIATPSIPVAVAVLLWLFFRHFGEEQPSVEHLVGEAVQDAFQQQREYANILEQLKDRWKKHKEGMGPLIHALRALRDGGSVRVLYVNSIDQPRAQEILAFYERANWTVPERAKQMPYTPLWDNRSGIVFEGRRAVEHADAFMQMPYKEVSVGRVAPLEEEVNSVRIYIITRPSSWQSVS